MPSDIEQHLLDLGQYAHLVDFSMRPLLEQAISLISDARSSLEYLDDPSAREALAHCSSAYDHVGNALYGWLNQYVIDAQRLVDALRS